MSEEFALTSMRSSSHYAAELLWSASTSSIMRLLVDFRANANTGPLLKVVARAESVEDRFRSIKRLRPEFAVPDR